jgi:hypothetical protein
MGLLGNLIVSVCVGAGDSYRSACDHALDAGAKQAGIERQADEVEQRNVRMADRYADDLVGDNGKSLIGGFLFIAKSAADRKMLVGLPNMGICSQMQSEITPTSAVLMLKWNF